MFKLYLSTRYQTTNQETRLLRGRRYFVHSKTTIREREGAAHGTLVGKIRMLQEILGDTVVGAPELLQRSADQLSKLLAELQERLRSRGD
jgi:hypothetical protein